MSHATTACFNRNGRKIFAFFYLFVYLYKFLFYYIFKHYHVLNTYSRVTIGLLCNNVMLFITIKIIDLKLFIKFSFFDLFFFKFIY